MCLPSTASTATAIRALAFTSANDKDALVLRWVDTKMDGGRLARDRPPPSPALKMAIACLPGWGSREY